MLSPRDIYPPEWFNESPTDIGASGKGKKKQPAPKYEVRQLASGCRVFQIINTKTKGKKR